MKARLLFSMLLAITMTFACQPSGQQGGEGEQTETDQAEENKMNESERIVRAWSKKHVKGADDATSYMSGKFMLTGPTTDTLNKPAYRSMMKSLREAFPDLNDNLKITSAEEGMVEGTIQMEGTHKGTLNLDAMSMGVYEPTEKSFKLPEESFKITVENGKITSMEVAASEEGGLAGIMKQLGLEMVK